ncbi:MAG: hypothetical protein F2947_07290 [Actinobacteria bacterium]|uniref:Unannotated protein n=1 Tax=freshwater metagenome TaxID=449393 RepID=A0A6J6R3J5_9ZZZZ|nr:hypothetical protein [Actinomycetota bacterium]MSX33837.1 hypothetical protein [Actinomycetota bacterium]MSX95210.1 hypothetical protein [Actinomycetota bacterium]MSY25582.1 hypothetical protein [Actinomycetota bacterium]MSZ51641.1 hypothetical protein [Actinomycetota bacterium]
MRVAFVTTSDLDAIHDDVDLPLQIVAFANAGIDLVQAAWEDESVAWDSFDLVVVRSPWNYVKRLNAFRKWLGDRRGLTTFHNPVELIEWNIDKRYLADLAHQGVPIVPTAFVDSIEEFHSAAQSFGSAEIVVKPSVSAGSRLTGRYLKTDRAAEVLASEILAKGLTTMVQPFAARIDAEGEIGTVLFDGMISHSFNKAALLAEGGQLVGGEYQEQITSVQTPDDVLVVVDAAASAATEVARGAGWISKDQQLLYGRYDVVRLDDGSPALLEAELFEPCFFLPIDVDAADRFVGAVLRRLSA